MESETTIEKIGPLIGRKIEYLTFDDVRKLLALLCQLQGLADDQGIFGVQEKELEK